MARETVITDNKALSKGAPKSTAGRLVSLLRRHCARIGLCYGRKFSKLLSCSSILRGGRFKCRQWTRDKRLSARRYWWQIDPFGLWTAERPNDWNGHSHLDKASGLQDSQLSPNLQKQLDLLDFASAAPQDCVARIEESWNRLARPGKPFP